MRHHGRARGHPLAAREERVGHGARRRWRRRSSGAASSRPARSDCARGGRLGLGGADLVGPRAGARSVSSCARARPRAPRSRSRAAVASSARCWLTKPLDTRSSWRASSFSESIGGDLRPARAARAPRRSRSGGVPLRRSSTCACARFTRSSASRRGGILVLGLEREERRARVDLLRRAARRASPACRRTARRRARIRLRRSPAAAGGPESAARREGEGERSERGFCSLSWPGLGTAGARLARRGLAGLEIAASARSMRWSSAASVRSVASIMRARGRAERAALEHRAAEEDRHREAAGAEAERLRRRDVGAARRVLLRRPAIRPSMRPRWRGELCARNSRAIGSLARARR